MSRNKHLCNVLEPFGGQYASHEERAAFAAGLRELADWLEETHFPVPSLSVSKSAVYGQAVVEVSSVWIDDEGFVKRAGTAARLIGGKVDKSVPYEGGNFYLERDFGGGVKFRYRIARDAVCEKVETTVMENRVVPEDEVAARSIEFQIEELKKELGEMPTAVRKVSVPKVEYVCPESLIVKEKTAEQIVDESVPF